MFKVDDGNQESLNRIRNRVYFLLGIPLILGLGFLALVEVPYENGQYNWKNWRLKFISGDSTGKQAAKPIDKKQGLSPKAPPTTGNTATAQKPFSQNNTRESTAAKKPFSTAPKPVLAIQKKGNVRISLLSLAQKHIYQKQKGRDSAMPLPGIEIRYVVSWESADDITSRQSEIEVYNPEGQVLNFDRRQMKNLSMPYDSYLEKNLTAYPLPENGQQLLRVYFLPLKTDHAKLTFFIRETINNEAYDFDFKKMPLP